MEFTNKTSSADFLGVTKFYVIFIQIAAISPADINYDETLSTLRYGEFFMRMRFYACFSVFSVSS